MVRKIRNSKWYKHWILYKWRRFAGKSYLYGGWREADKHLSDRDLGLYLKRIEDKLNTLLDARDNNTPQV